MQSRIKTVTNDLTEIPRAQRRSIRQPLSYYVENYILAKEGMRKAFETGRWTKPLSRQKNPFTGTLQYVLTVEYDNWSLPWIRKNKLILMNYTTVTYVL